MKKSLPFLIIGLVLAAGFLAWKLLSGHTAPMPVLSGGSGMTGGGSGSGSGSTPLVLQPATPSVLGNIITAASDILGTIFGGGKTASQTASQGIQAGGGMTPYDTYTDPVASVNSLFSQFLNSDGSATAFDNGGNLVSDTGNISTDFTASNLNDVLSPESTQLNLMGQ